MKKSVALIVLLFAVSAFARDKAPEWIKGTSKAHPLDSYLVGVGEGSEKGTAENDAMSQIAKQIEVKIKSVISDKQAEEITGKGGKSALSSYSESFSKVSTSETQKVLEGIQLADTYEDKDTKKFYVLAVLERSKAAKTLRDRITGMDADLAKLASSATGANVISDIKNLKKAQKISVQREALNSDLRVISPEGTGVEAKESAQSIGKKIDEAIQNLKVGVKLEGSAAEAARNAIVESLNNTGFSVVDEEESKLDVLIKGKANVEELKGPDPAYDWAVCVLSADLVDQKTKRVFGRVSERTREGAKGAARALDTAARKLSKKVAEAVGQKFLEYIEK